MPSTQDPRIVWQAFRQFMETRLYPNDARKIAFYTLAHGVYNLLAGGFEIALILRLSGSVERIAVIHLFIFTLLFLSFVGASLALRTGKASRNFRLDLLMQAAAGAYMLVNFGNLGNPGVLAGFFVFKGLSEGSFWSTRHSALLHCIGDEKRDDWALKLQTLIIVMSVLVPVASGFVISHFVLPVPEGQTGTTLPSGYYPVYAMLVLISLCSLFLSPTLRIPGQNTSLRKAYSLLHARHAGDWAVYSGLGSISGVTVSIAVGVLNFSILKTEFNMGIFSSWIALASAGFFHAIRFLPRHVRLSRMGMVAAGDSGDILSRTLYWFFPVLPGLIGKSLLDGFIVPLRGVFGDNIIRRRAELLSRAHGVSIAETMIFQESVLFLGRSATCTVLIVAFGFLDAEPVPTARTLLSVFMAYGLADFFLVRRIDRGNGRMENGEK